MNGQYAYTPLIWLPVFTVLVLIALAIYSFRRRSVPGALPFVFGLLLGALWMAGISLEVAAVDASAKFFWVKFQTVWQLPGVTSIACFLLEYAWPGRWLTRRNLALLSIPCLLNLGMILTDDLHHLYWQGFVLDGRVTPLNGPGNWIFLAFAYGLTIVNLFVLVWLFIRSPQHRWPAALMLAGQIGGRVIYGLDAVGVIHPNLPIEFFAFWIPIPMYMIALFGFRILNPIPLARQTAIEQMQAGMLVLDLEGRVISLNPAAERILNAPAKQVKGKLVNELLPAYPEKNLADPGEAEIELGIGEGSSLRYYMLRIWPLNDFRGLTVGLMLLLTDVTEQKRTQALLVEQQRALAMLQERDKVARELHDELAQGLAFINLQAQATGEQLAAGDIQQVSAHLARLAEVARETHADVREQISELSLGILPRDGFLKTLSGFLKTFSQTYGIQAELILPDSQPVMALEPTAEVQLLRIIQEAFTNIRKHARARRARVSLARHPAGIEVIVSDDGNGFDPRGRADSGGTFGLRFMQERAAEIGGSLRVESEAGGGTRVIVRIPNG